MKNNIVIIDTRFLSGARWEAKTAWQIPAFHRLLKAAAMQQHLKIQIDPNKNGCDLSLNFEGAGNVKLYDIEGLTRLVVSVFETNNERELKSFIKIFKNLYLEKFVFDVDVLAAAQNSLISQATVENEKEEFWMPWEDVPESDKRKRKILFYVCVTDLTWREIGRDPEIFSPSENSLSVEITHLRNWFKQKYNNDPDKRIPSGRARDRSDFERLFEERLKTASDDAMQRYVSMYKQCEKWIIEAHQSRREKN